MKEKKQQRPGIAFELYFWAQALVFALVILVGINVFFFRISGVDGYSMNPTLENHDQIIMRIIGVGAPRRGDVIVVKAEAFKDEPLVKRVIGLEGDVIDLDPETGNLSVNGEVKWEPYIKERIRDFGNQSYPFTVPAGSVFVMGDNRNASTDSRDRRVGALPYEYIIGKVVLRVWPLRTIGRIL